MIQNFRRERQIRKALRAVAMQRVSLILQPGNVFMIERSPPDEDWFNEAMQTSLIRGWVAVLHDSIPSGEINLSPAGAQLPQMTKCKTVFRLTEGGWVTLNRSHDWVVATCLVAVVTLVATIVPYVVVLPKP